MDYSPINIRMWSKLGSCGAYGTACLELPGLNDKTVVLTADLCFFSGLERFQNQYPDHFYNIGIAEQNMLGIAAGLAKEGFTVFASTYASFASTRSFEQARLHLGYSKFNIKLVGLTSGLSVGILGGTHIAIEDIAVMRAIPNIVILSPADCTETVKATIAAAQYNGPVYIRLTGGMNCPIVYKSDYDFTIGKAVTLREGEDVAIFATGSMVHESLLAADILSKEGISATVVNVHTIKPLDTELIEQVLKKTKLAVTVEEHSIIGGLGGAIAEYKAQLDQAPSMMMIGIEDCFPHAGEYEYMLRQCGLKADIIAERIMKKLIR